MKYLIWGIILIAVVVWLGRVKKRVLDQVNAAAAARHPGQSAPLAQVEHMVQCAYCGIHFPASEAVMQESGAIFCSVEHLQMASSS